MKTIININQKIATYYNTVMFRLREKLKCEDGGVTIQETILIVIAVALGGMLLAATVNAFTETIIPTVLNKITDMFNLS